MDALEFLREHRRVCRLHKDCHDCPLYREHCSLSTQTSDEDYQRVINVVEKWSKEHPRKTRQSVFLEQYPEAQTDIDDMLCVCPKIISAAHRDSSGVCKTPEKLCVDCRREFWMQEVE